MKYILGILCFLIALRCLIASGMFSRFKSPPDPDKKDLQLFAAVVEETLPAFPTKLCHVSLVIS